MENVIKTGFIGRNRKSWLGKIVESPALENTIIFIIILNAITLGLETIKGLPIYQVDLLARLDSFFLSVFIGELLLKMTYYRTRFFNDPWRVFDFVVVGIACFPASGPFSVLRSLRVLRTLRMISAIPSLKKVVNGLIQAVPGLGAVVIIIGIIFYVGAVMATKLFGATFPDWFGSIGASSYSLFQIMTLESWSMGIVRPILEVYPYAWMFFVPFIIISTFTMLNLFIAVIVNAMQAETDESAQERADLGQKERSELLNELILIRKKLEKIETKSDRL